MGIIFEISALTAGAVAGWLFYGLWSWVFPVKLSGSSRLPEQREQKSELWRLEERRLRSEKRIHQRQRQWKECFEELTERVRERKYASAYLEEIKRADAPGSTLARVYEQVAKAQQRVAEAREHVQDLSVERIAQNDLERRRAESTRRRMGEEDQDNKVLSHEELDREIDLQRARFVGSKDHLSGDGDFCLLDLDAERVGSSYRYGGTTSGT